MSPACSNWRNCPHRAGGFTALEALVLLVLLAVLALTSLAVYRKRESMPTTKDIVPINSSIDKVVPVKSEK